MQMLQIFVDRRGVRSPATNQMVMVGKHRPGFNPPTILLRQRQEFEFEQIQTRRVVEKMHFVQRAGRHQVNTVFGHLVNWCMRPRLP
jgi:hypothetical protein